MNLGPQPSLGKGKSYPETCFHLKNYFLQQAILPQTFRRRIKVLLHSHAEEAAKDPAFAGAVEKESRQVSGGAYSKLYDRLKKEELPGFDATPLLYGKKKNPALLFFMRNYEKSLATLKLKMAGLQHALPIAYTAKCMVVLQRAYEKQLYNSFRVLFGGVENRKPELTQSDVKDVKMAEQVSSADIIEALKFFGLEEQGIEEGDEIGEKVMKHLDDGDENAREMAGFMLSECYRVKKLESLMKSSP